MLTRDQETARVLQYVSDFDAEEVHKTKLKGIIMLGCMSRLELQAK